VPPGRPSVAAALGAEKDSKLLHTEIRDWCLSETGCGTKIINEERTMSGIFRTEQRYS
jgi:hypothetical protein